MTQRQGRPAQIFDKAFLTDAENVTEVLLIRHGQQDVKFGGPVGDIIDPPLSEQGREQARLVGAALSTKSIDAIFCSTLERARATAQAIASHHRLEPVEVDDLREVELFRDVPRDQTAEQFIGKELLRAVRQRMLTEQSWDVYPYSESSFEFKKRTINAIETLIARHENQRICIVCHGGVINAYIGHIIGTPHDMFFRPGHTSVNIVAAGGGRRALHLLNDVYHLRAVEGDFVSY